MIEFICISGKKRLQSIWKSKRDESYMIIRRGNSTENWENSENWERVLEFYTFEEDVGYGTKHFFVSKPGSIGIARRFIQETIDQASEMQYSFWALTNWEPGLKVNSI